MRGWKFRPCLFCSSVDTFRSIGGKWHEMESSGKLVERLLLPMAQDETRLESWKQIAEYLNKDVSTVIRWEKERGLPVHRIPGQKRSGVYAWPSEVSAWLNNGEAERAGTNGKAEAIPVRASSAETAGRSRAVWITTSVSIALLAGAAGLLSVWPAPDVPQLVKTAQLTSDGQEKWGLAAAGAALYFASSGVAAETITRVDQSGRNPLRLSFTGKGIEILDVSTDGARLLVVERDAPNRDFPLWVVPTDGRSPRGVHPQPGWEEAVRCLSIGRTRRLDALRSQDTAIRDLSRSGGSFGRTRHLFKGWKAGRLRDVPGDEPLEDECRRFRPAHAYGPCSASSMVARWAACRLHELIRRQSQTNQDPPGFWRWRSRSGAGGIAGMAGDSDVDR